MIVETKTERKILGVIVKEVSVDSTRLSKLLDTTPSNAAKHLSNMYKKELLRREKIGKIWVYSPTGELSGATEISTKDWKKVRVHIENVDVMPDEGISDKLLDRADKKGDSASRGSYVDKLFFTIRKNGQIGELLVGFIPSDNIIQVYDGNHRLSVYRYLYEKYKDSRFEILDARVIPGALRDLRKARLVERNY